ncbi:MAG: MoaD/ThiS family protein [Nitrososphaeraceae archaeon]
MIEDTGCKIDLRLYASIKDVLGKDRIDIDWTKNMTVGDLRKQLDASYPILSIVNARFSISVNRKPVDDSELIRNTDEIAVLPPISGG